MKPTKETEFVECLAGYVMGDLTTDEFKEHESVKTSGGATALNDLERIAATVSLAAIDQIEALPEGLRRAVSITGRAIVSEVATRRIADVVELAPPQTARVRERLAWIACLAASLLTIYFWQIGSYQRDRQVVAAVSRETLIANSPDLIQRSWKTATLMKDKSISGDIVWSGTAQSGYMRFVGMPVNDPGISQYQLWIYDLSRDTEPVDGGVFDIKSAEENIVAIQAKLRVDEPILFAVTIEQPGGVVVSDLHRLSLMAFVDSNND